MSSSIIRVLKRIKRGIAYGAKCLFVFCKGSYTAIKTLSKGKRFERGNNQDKEVVVFGNGPSLKEIDLLEVSEKHQVACVNWFLIRNENFSKIRPAYYFLIDPAFFGEGGKKFYDKKVEIEKVLSVLEHVDWNMEVIIPQGKILNVKNDNLTISYIPSQIMDYNYLKGFQKLLYRHNLAVCGLQNVMCAVLHFFIVKHFRTVYLAGVDMSEFKDFTINERNHILVAYNHSYGIQNADLTEAGSIPPGGFGEYLGYYAKMLQEIYTLSKFAEEENVKVVNLSKQSYIDVFEKQDWNSIL